MHQSLFLRDKQPIVGLQVQTADKVSYHTVSLINEVASSCLVWLVTTLFSSLETFQQIKKKQTNSDHTDASEYSKCLDNECGYPD